MASHLTRHSFFLFFFKIMIWLLLLVLSLLIVIPIATYLFFDPDEYKTQISAFISEKTGLPVTISGKIELKLIPWIGLNVTKVNLQSNNHEKFMAKIGEIGFKIPLSSIFQKQLLIDALIIKEIQLHFYKQLDGSPNLSFLSKKHSVNEEKSKQSDLKGSKHKLHFELKQFTIESGSFYYEDDKKNQNLVFKNWQLNGQHQEKMRYFLTGQGDFVTTFSNAKVDGHGKIKGHIAFPTRSLETELHTLLTFNYPLLAIENGRLNTDLVINDNKISLNNLTLSSEKLNAKGTCTIPKNPQSPITFKMHMDEWEAVFKEEKSQQKSIQQNSPSIIQKSQKSQTASWGSTSHRTVEGKLTISKLKVKEFLLQNVKSNIKYSNSQLTSHPLTATLYQGQINANITHAFNNRSTHFQGVATNLPIENLLRELKQSPKISGNANFNFTVVKNTEGLFGTTQCQIKNGIFEGIDVKYFLNMAQSLLKKETLHLTNTKQTPFSELYATLKMHDNLIDNNDLKITSTDFVANGDGSIDLNNQTLSYKVHAFRHYNAPEKHSHAYPLALRISGPFKQPIVVPDFDLYLKTVMQKEVKTELEKKLHKGLNKILGESPANSSSDDPNTQEKLKEKLNKGLEKGLKKIFKIEK